MCPGPTKTEFAKRSGKNDASFAMEAEKVAEIGYRGMQIKDFKAQLFL